MDVQRCLDKTERNHFKETAVKEKEDFLEARQQNWHCRKLNQYACTHLKISPLGKQGKEGFRWCIAKIEKEILSKNIAVSKEENETTKNNRNKDPKNLLCFNKTDI